MTSASLVGGWFQKRCFKWMDADVNQVKEVGIWSLA